MDPRQGVPKKRRKSAPLPLSNYELTQVDLQKSRLLSVRNESKADMRFTRMPISPPLTNNESLPTIAGSQFTDHAARKLQAHFNDSDSILHSVPNVATRNIARSDIIRKIAKPALPVRVNQIHPTELPWHAQQRIMKWRYKWDLFGPTLCWLINPDANKIKTVVQPHLERLGHDCNTVSVRFLDEGSFNKIYVVRVKDLDHQAYKEYIFRVAIPIEPYYKTESDIATTEIVRHFTQIPVPMIYAFDSSMDNDLGLEWILMEKIRGNPLYDTWSEMSNNQQMHIVRMTANWTKQLAEIQADKIGGIYMESVDDELIFYVGRSLDLLLIQDTRRLFEIERGPFITVQRYYSAILDAAGKEVNALLDKLINVAQDTDTSSSKSDSTNLSQDSTKVGIEEDEISRKGREVDEENAEWREFSPRRLVILQNAILLLQSALPELCERSPEISGPLITYLTHQDMSLSNIMVDDLGNPVALLDWELMQLEPMYFLSAWPKYLLDGELSRPPSSPPIFVGKSSAPNEENGETQRNQEQDWYRGKMHEYISTKLRPKFLEELQRIGSLLAAAASRDDRPYHEDLHFRITELNEKCWEHGQWVKDLTGIEMNFDDDEVESGATSDEENSETVTD